MNEFVFTYPTAVYFGKDAAKKHLKDALKGVKKVMLVTGGGSVKKTGIFDDIMNLLQDVEVVEFAGIPSNPTWSKVQEGARLAKQEGVDFILALGGGSVIDASKIIAAQAATDENCWNAFVHEHRLPREAPLPLGAIVTASGTGAEMNGGAVITNEDEQVKTGVFAKAPVFAILDPSYLNTVPVMQVFSGAFDTWCHALESYLGVSEGRNITDDLSLAVMENTIANMEKLKKDLYDENARGNLEWDSAMAENGILKVGKPTCFQVHMIEHQLGAFTDCSHGQGLAVLEPAYLRYIAKSDPAKLARMFRAVFHVGNPDNEQAIEEGLQALEAFIASCGLPTRLKDLRSRVEITDEILDKIADTAVIVSTGPVTLNREDIRAILEACK